MKIADLEVLPNCQCVAVDNNTGHAIAIIRAGQGDYSLYDGNSMATPHATSIQQPEGRTTFSADEVREMFASRKLSVLRGFMPD